MASTPSPRHQTTHHIPGVPLTYNNTSANTPPYQPYTPPKSPHDHIHHQESFSSYLPQTNSQQIRVLQETINRLQLVDSSRAEAITEQKIEIAVLKNDLYHAKQKVNDKEAVINSLGIVIGSITRGASVAALPQALEGTRTTQALDSESKISALETEIEHYRKSDRRMRSRIQNLEREAEARGHEKERENDAGSYDREHKVRVREDGWVDCDLIAQTKASEKGKGNLIEGDIGLGLGSANPPQSQQEYHHTIKAGLTGSQLVGSWGEDFHANLPNIPNTPATGQSFNPVNADVGMCSLEDFLDNDGYPALNFQPPLSGRLSTIPSTASNNFPPSITAQSSSLTTDAQFPRIEEDERHIDEQIKENQEAMAQFSNMPTPGVIRTGFQREGTFRGQDYDKMKVIQPLQNFGRFAPRNFGSQPCQSRRGPPTGPRAMLEPSLDKSFDHNLWDDSQDLNGAVEAHMRAANGRGDTRFPDLFRYGIQYIPVETDSNYLRTVTISNLPLGTTVLDVLARVRGGEVLSASIVKMGLIAPDTLQARVVFKHEAAAEEYANYASSHPICFGDDATSEVTVVSTPTYPISAKTQSRLREQTRCLSIPCIPHNFSPDALEYNLACGNGHRAQGLIEIYVDSAYTLHLEFSSIELANSAWNILQSRSNYRGMQCHWEADSCAGDVEELKLELPPRPKMLPDNWSENRGAVDVDGVVGGARKTLAALEKQEVIIPDLAAVKLKATSWADEVNDEFEDEDFTKTGGAKGRAVGENEFRDSGSGGEGKKPASDFVMHGVDLATSQIGIESPEIIQGQLRKASAWNNSQENKPSSSSKHQNTTTIGASQSTTVQPTTKITVLTADQELSAAINAFNTNKDLATPTSNSSSTFIAATPALPSQNRSVGLAGSKYSSPTPDFVDTASRPRSFNRSTSSLTFDSPSVPDLGSIQNLVSDEPASKKQRFSYSPPRVDLDDLIKSARSSLASQGVGGGHVREEMDNRVEVESEEIGEKEVEMAKKPRVQLFKWFKPSSVADEKRGCDGAEEEVDKLNLESRAEKFSDASNSPSPTAPVEQEVIEEKVVNPDEVDLEDENEDDGSAEETLKFCKAVFGLDL
ncbi:hypothetical protein WAI453_007211 [Rhynchosporium graminicola]|uniref:RRM domain-containing protein n=1 Tax=Rhynchosporium graminicola TaxID=2792576 RepID=A0A1E1LFI3_9HELO|nr:uncharacterized protein RCO7_08184 [Rhynchosporium commune]